MKKTSDVNDSNRSRRTFLKGAATATAVAAALSEVACSQSPTSTPPAPQPSDDHDKHGRAPRPTFTVRDARQFKNGKPDKSIKKWNVYPPVGYVSAADGLTVLLIDPDNVTKSFDLELPSDYFNPPQTSGKKITATLTSKATPGTWIEFDVKVDGIYVEAHSSPSVIIE